MSGLPQGWEIATVGALINGIEAGKNFRCIEQPPMPGELGVIKVSAVTWGRFQEDESKTVPMGTSVDERARIHEGDLLMSRANTLELVGAVVRVESHQRQLYLSDKVLRLNAPVELRPWLHRYLSSPDARKAIAEASSGNQLSMRNISQGAIAALPLPLAPLAEQKRIADKLDTLLARIDACRERLERVPGVIKRFRQAVLVAAQSGGLTIEWRETNGEKELWQQTTVQQIAMVGTGSTPLRSNSDFFAATGTPWITSAATADAMVNEANKFVTDAAIKAHRLKKYPPGTLLVAMYGEGKTRGQVTELAIEATINQACAAIVVDEKKASRCFVKLMLQANYLEMRALAEGGNQPNLNLSKVKEFGIPLPGLDEQAEIVRRIEKLFALADALESRLRTARTAADRLTPATLNKAFRGELVPQDPSDEPAQALLDRLRSDLFGAAPVRLGRRVAAAAAT